MSNPSWHRTVLHSLAGWYRWLWDDTSSKNSIEEKIACLRNLDADETNPNRQQENENLRRKLQAALKRFLEAGGPESVLVLLSSLSLTMLERVLARQGRFTLSDSVLASLRADLSRNKNLRADDVIGRLSTLKDQGFQTRQEYLAAIRRQLNEPEIAPVLRRLDPGENLFDLTNVAGGHDDEWKPPRGRELPPEVQGYFHQIRNYANRVRHDPNFQATIGQARIALDAFVEILEWYFGPYSGKDRAAIYNPTPDWTVLPTPPLSWLPPVLTVLFVLLGISGSLAALLGKLPWPPVVLLLGFLLLLLTASSSAYTIFREHAYTGTGRWRRWWILWASLFASTGLLVATFSSLFVGFPQDTTEYIALELRVGRTDPPREIPLTPTRYTKLFNNELASVQELGDRVRWARADSLTSWKNWLRKGIQTGLNWPHQEVIIYESQPIESYYSSFTAALVFGGTQRVHLLDSLALLRRVDPTSKQVLYQQIDFWYSESEPELEQLVTKNELIMPPLNQGDVILLIAKFAALDGKSFSEDNLAQVFAATFQRKQ